MKIVSLSRPHGLAKNLFINALCFGAALVRADSVHVLFEPHALHDVQAESHALFTSLQAVQNGAPGAPPGTATGRADTAWMMPFANETVQRAIENHLQGIDAIVQRDGAYAPALSEPMLSLGKLYQHADQHDEAIAMLARARHVSRVNHGLNTPEQFPAIELTINSYLALHDYQHATEQQQVLVQLHRSRYGKDAPELVPELITLADMYLSAFERWHLELPGGSGMMPAFGEESGFADPSQLQPIDVAFIWLHHAQRSYMDSIRILLVSEDYTNPKLQQLERQVIATLFLQAYRKELDMDRAFFISASEKLRVRGRGMVEQNADKMDFYRSGEEALERMLFYLQQDPATPPAAIVEVMLELGDWHRLFGWHRQSRIAYDDADRFIRAREKDEATVARLLAPEVPVQLPAFLPAPYSIEGAAKAGRDLDSIGYIDVTFKLDAYGNATNIEVLSRSANANKSVESRLLHVLGNAPFRPQIAADEGQPVAVRYQFAQY